MSAAAAADAICPVQAYAEGWLTNGKERYTTRAPPEGAEDIIQPGCISMYQYCHNIQADVGH